MNKLTELIQYGQSYWLDDLSRRMIRSGELKKRVTGQGLRGITSNPTIFDKAISGSNDYDAQIKKLAGENYHVHKIYEKLAVKDVQDACDILRPVYDSTGCTDGFVSLEVSPYLAHDTEGTINEVRRLFGEVNRPNCFIKIPGTAEGIPAIEQMLYEGINVNITLLFSIERYEAVANAYIRAIKKRLDEGKPINNVSSVASFFLSRIDVLTDSLLGHRIKPGSRETEGALPQLLLGKIAVASARLAYQKFKSIFSSNEWRVLAHHGAKVQRPLWASTSTKDPLYDDVKYVNPLIGKDTVNTLPEDTISDFSEHGELKHDTIDESIQESEKYFKELEEAGIDINFVTKQLENEGIQKFVDSYNELMKKVSGKRIQILGNKTALQTLSTGDLSKKLKSAYRSLDEKLFGQRMFHKDPYLWTSDKETAKSVYNRLGWLESITEYSDKIKELTSFADEIRSSGFKSALLLGMGGSSLCPEVSALTFGSKKGYPQLFVLDNTFPEAIRNFEESIDLNNTLFIVSSKSGTTKETVSFYRYFYSKLEKSKGDKTGENFIAITDPGSWLSREGVQRHFRHVFENRPDIGGRYSALSYFGLVPMILIGMDINTILNDARMEQLNSGPFVPAESNPAVNSGVTLGLNYRKGRNKLTFIISEPMKAFGSWVEQLIAESTGKSGRGFIPVVDETLGNPDKYGPDRVFIYIKLAGILDSTVEKKIASLEKAGHPVLRIEMKNKLQIGAQYFRWETAVAAAGMMIGINPFDEPNVAESKQNTNNILEDWKLSKSFPEEVPVIDKDGIKVFCSNSAEWYTALKTDKLNNFIKSYLKLLKPGDYLSLLPYFLNTPARNKILQSVRTSLRDRFKAATTLGFGPRYLHSTGQLHKGGPNKGVFVIFTSDPVSDIEIPGEEYGFATLQFAQALGDYRSLLNHGRRVIRIHLGKNIEEGLKKIKSILK